MIRRVRIRGFKRFADTEFRLPGHVVLAGPNNTGKTTLLQAISAWALALDRWKELGNYNRRRGYQRAPIARQAFTAVPLRHFDLLWTHRRSGKDVEIEIEHGSGWTVAVEIKFNSSEQAYVRPHPDVPPEVLREMALPVVFIPPMTGLAQSPRRSPCRRGSLGRADGSGLPALRVRTERPRRLRTGHPGGLPRSGRRA